MDDATALLREKLAEYAYQLKLRDIALTDNEALRAIAIHWPDLPADQKRGFFEQADEQIALIRECGFVVSQ